MPHSTLKLIPGVDQNRTLALNEAAISETNLVRFIPDKQNIGLVQKLGGWVKYFNTSLSTIVRCLWAWEDTNAVTYLAIGSEGNSVNGQGLSVLSSGSRTVITPTLNNYNIGLYTSSSTSQHPFYYAIATASTSGTTATITFTGYHFFSVGDYVYVSGCSVAAYNGAHYVTGAPAYNQVEFDIAALTGAGVGGSISYGNGLQTTVGSSTVTFNFQGSNVNDYCAINIRTPISIGGLILFGLYPLIYQSVNSFEVTATDALGNPALATSGAQPFPGDGQIPVYYYTADQAYVYVYLPDHGYLAGDTYPVLNRVTNGSVTIFGNYEILSLGDSLGANTTSYFKIGTNTTASKTTPVSIGGDGSYATVVVSIDYEFSIGDTVVISGASTAGFNTAGSIVVDVTTGVTTRTIKYANATVAAPAYDAGCTAFNSIGLSSNNGLADIVIYRSPAPLPLGTGYGVGGYGVGGYGNGVIPPSGTAGLPINCTDWSLDNWGSYLISCPVYYDNATSTLYGGSIYEWSPNSGSSISSVIPEAPSVNDGVFVAMPQRQIIAWGSTFSGIQDPLLIRWCDVNDFNSWIPLPTNQAGSYRIPRGSKIVGCLQGPQQGLVWTDLAVWAMQYSGPPYVYQFNEIGTGCGLISRKAAASMNGVVYWMSQSQFYMLGGSGVQPITCPIWDVIFQDLDTSNLDKIRIAPNSRFGEVTWYYPTLSNGGEVNAYVKYNVILQQWDFGTLSRTAWINQSVLGAPIGAGPLSSGVNYLYQHEVSQNADGAVMLSSFQTGYFVISDGEWKVFIDQVWPDMKWGLYNGQQNAHVNLTFYVTDYPGDTPRVYGPYNLSVDTEFITPRFRGRLISIKIESDPTELNTFWRLGAMRYRYEQDGKF